MTPRCRHFGVCGGCRLQDQSYEDQLVLKRDRLKELLSRVSHAGPRAFHPSPEPWYYRNKMEFSFQDVFPVPAAGEDPLLLGLKVRNRWDKVMNLEECHLMAPEVPALLASVHDWARKEGLEPYNLHKQKGFLRHMVVRQGKNTGQWMINLLTAEGKLPEKSFVAAVQKAVPATTILHGVHREVSDVAVSEGVKVLHGPGYITEQILGKTLRISPYSFCQTNTRGAELLYGILRQWIEPLKAKTLLDLYCGGGGITLSVADLCERVMGVELVESAIDDARHNAALNKVTNCDFMTAKVEDILPGLAAQKIDVDAVITDPPRSGLHPTAAKALKEMAPAWIIYVSCNPKAMVEDLRRLADLYDIHAVEGVDLFPHTDHMESAALLRRIY
ncbi:MAG: 23S rRNA (uracil(1939)-C(5))-methyltransferase RlmD [Elusimicrobia bacterium]|nr:23S rRNA (uracil(1939)-C(5))-methyltransferase RlmD [Elusimicrobiota bacterium]